MPILGTSASNAQSLGSPPWRAEDLGQLPYPYCVYARPPEHLRGEDGKELRQQGPPSSGSPGLAPCNGAIGPAVDGSDGDEEPVTGGPGLRALAEGRHRVQNRNSNWLSPKGAGHDVGLREHGLDMALGFSHARGDRGIGSACRPDVWQR